MRCLTLFCVLFLTVNVLVANPLEPLSDNTLRFDSKLANASFDRINIQLSTQNLNKNNLNVAIKTLDEFTEQAQQCITDGTKKLANISHLIAQNATVADQNSVGADQLYLSKEKKKISDRISQCRLFSIRATEATEAYKTTIAQLTEDEVLTRGLPLWDLIHELIASPPENSLGDLIQLEIPTALKSPILWVVLVTSSLFMSAVFWFKLRKTYFAKHFIYIKKLHIRHALLVALCLLTAAMFTYVLVFFPETYDSQLFLNLSKKLFLYFLCTALILFTSKLKRVRTLLNSCSIDLGSFKAALLVFLNFYTLISMGHSLNNKLKPSPVLLQFEESVLLLVIIATGIYFIYYLSNAHRHFSLIKHHKRAIKTVGLLMLSACGILTISGYHALAFRTSYATFITFISLFMTGLIIHSINKMYYATNHHDAIKTKIMNWFGYKPDQIFTELLILKTMTQFIVIVVSLFLILNSWGFASYYINSTYHQILYGIHLGGATIYPTRIIMGVAVYCVLYLVFRSISTAISRQQQFEDEEETQVAIASIFTYLGFTLALVSALLVAGFNFTGLAIVAGALSVGIGLGLQSIVNNFVSGLILLIEKPIKPGDRINIDGVEGFVKKIRVRSTHILTPAQEDIIIPNSDLITRRVTNYVYSNKQYSINCEINVPLGSDTQCVRELLLEAANNHEDVIKTGRNKPYVLFSSFGEKSLVFKLCCLIKDVNKKLLVQSDLNFAIDELLREKKI